MKKLSFLLILLIAFSSVYFGQTQESEKKDPTKPTPEREIRTGVISVVGLLGPVQLSKDDYSTENPSMKILIFWNFNPHFSLGFGGGVHKYEGPASFLIEDEGYYISSDFLVQIEDDYYFGVSKFEETWYSAQLNFKFLDGSFSPYIFAGLKYISIDYQQEMFFKYIGISTLNDTVWEVTLNSLGFFAGGGLSFSMMDYLDLIFEVDYTEILDSDIVPGRILYSFGFRFNI